MKQAYLFTLLAILCWTTGPVGSKAALLSGGQPALGPLQVAFWAIAAGAVVLWLWVLAGRRAGLLGGIAARGWPVLALMGVTGWFGYPVAINFAYTRMPLADALVVCYAAPVFVVVFQAPAFGRVLRLVSGWEAECKRQVHAGQVGLGLGLCLLGVAFTATGGQPTRLASLHLGVGALSALLAAVLWGIYSNLGRFVPVCPHAEGAARGDVQSAAGMVCGLACMGGLLAAGHRLAPPLGYSSLLHLGPWGQASVPVVGIVAVMGLFNYAVGYPLWMHALELGEKAGGAHRLPALNYLLLLLSVVLGWLLLRQGFGPGFWPGAACIAAGNLVNLWPRGERIAKSHRSGPCP